MFTHQVFKFYNLKLGKENSRVDGNIYHTPSFSRMKFIKVESG